MRRSFKSSCGVKGIHAARLLTYMKLAGVKTGLLINFNVIRLKDGIRRFVLSHESFVLFVSFVVFSLRRPLHAIKQADGRLVH